MDLAASLLGYLTKGRGWDVPEAWYFLAKAYGMQGRKERERDALGLSLSFRSIGGLGRLGLRLGGVFNIFYGSIGHGHALFLFVGRIITCMDRYI